MMEHLDVSIRARRRRRKRRRQIFAKQEGMAKEESRREDLGFCVFMHILAV